MAISKRTRFEVFKRDRFTCQYCGKRPPEVMLEVDHIVPVCEDGPDTMENLTTSCYPCNRGKAGTPLGTVAPALDEMEKLSALQEMLERRSSMAQQIKVAQASERTIAQALALVRRWWDDVTGLPREFDEVGARRFVQLLSLDKIRDAADVTATFLARKEYYRDSCPEKVWKYFCGVCWTMIRDGEVEA